MAYRGIGAPAKMYYNELQARKALVEKYGEGLFKAGTHVYISGTPLYMEAFANNMPFANEGKTHTSDYILCARTEEYQIRGNEIPVDEETIDKLAASVKDISTEAELKDFRDIFGRLCDKETSEEARKELWRIVDSNKDKYKELEKVLMNTDVRRSRSILLNTMGDGGIDIENIRQALMEVNRQISELDIRPDLKNAMLKELDDIYAYCREKADPVNRTVSIDDWNNKYSVVKAAELGAERLRFDELLRRETEKTFSRNMTEPEIILIQRKDLEEHIDQCMKTVPEKLKPFFEDFYDKLRHCLETTDREISLDNLDKDDANRVPFILHSAVFANQAADSYEATFTVSDGKNCWCESARMNKDGDVSITSATINPQGIVDDLEVERHEDVTTERIEIQEETQAEVQEQNDRKEAKEYRTERSEEAEVTHSMVGFEL